MSTVNGVVEVKSDKWGKNSILVNGQWYSTKFDCNCEKGDTVEFDDGGSKWINKLRVVAAGGGGGGSYAVSSGGGGGRPPAAPAFPVGTNTRERSIVRQSSLNRAVDLITGSLPLLALDDSTSWEDTEAAIAARAQLAVNVAGVFEAYAAGDGEGDIEAGAEVHEGVN